jgi:predicted enzyme related to lactoylglutathione lyase
MSEHKSNPVIHFELPMTNADRIRKFYERAFGWQTQPLGPEAGNFVMAFTAESDENRIPKVAGAINGGFSPRTKPEERVKVTILVDDIADARKKIEAAGGKILGGTKPNEVDEIPGIGKFLQFEDTEGNVLTVYEDANKTPLPRR